MFYLARFPSVGFGWLNRTKLDTQWMLILTCELRPQEKDKKVHEMISSPCRKTSVVQPVRHLNCDGHKRGSNGWERDENQGKLLRGSNF